MKKFFVLISFKPGYSGVFFCEKNYYEKNRNTPFLYRGQKFKKPHFYVKTGVFRAFLTAHYMKIMSTGFETLQIGFLALF